MFTYLPPKDSLASDINLDDNNYFLYKHASSKNHISRGTQGTIFRYNGRVAKAKLSLLNFSLNLFEIKKNESLATLVHI